jgi:tetratricopeptide (TPR) repeat protein
VPLEDRFGLALTTNDAAAAADYIAGIDLLLSANPGAEPLFDRALAADPDFALAHIAKARLCHVQARIAEAKAEAAAARELAARVDRREARHIEIIAQAIDGNGTRAMALVEEHVADYPRDGFALSLALGVFGLLGFSGRIDHHEAQLALLLRLSPHWGEDWWFLTYLGWARIETGDVAGGAAEVERALAGNPRNAFAAHARAHGYYEAGDPEHGASWRAETPTGHERSISTPCALPYRRRRPCSVSPTQLRSFGAGRSMRPAMNLRPGQKSRRIRGSIFPRPAFISPMSTPLWPKARAAIRLVAKRASPRVASG